MYLLHIICNLFIVYFDYIYSIVFFFLIKDFRIWIIFLKKFTAPKFFFNCPRYIVLRYCLDFPKFHNLFIFATNMKLLSFIYLHLHYLAFYPAIILVLKKANSNWSKKMDFCFFLFTWFFFWDKGIKGIHPYITYRIDLPFKIFEFQVISLKRYTMMILHIYGKLLNLCNKLKFRSIDFMKREFSIYVIT